VVRQDQELVTSSPAAPHLVLVGGGHAHLQVLAAIRGGSWPAVRCTLISPARAQVYSGMVPGYLQGTYDHDDEGGTHIAFDLPGLCSRAGVTFVEAAALRIDGSGGQRVVETEAGGAVPFDLASVDVGSVPAGLELPGVRAHTLSLRPMDRAVALRDRIDALAERGTRGVRLVVVGAGAAGFEVALALHRRLADRGARPLVTLVEGGALILDRYSERVRRKAAGVLRRRGVTVLTSAPVASVLDGGVVLANGASLEADAVVWTTGAAPPPVLARSSLPLGRGGWFAVDATLRAVDGSPVWGAGDCVEVAGLDLPKAGVYAVREAPILAHNLRAALVGGEPRPYRPQRSFLSLLNTADGRALVRWKGLVSHSRWGWWLKDRIDRRFVEMHRLGGEGG